MPPCAGPSRRPATGSTESPVSTPLRIGGFVVGLAAAFVLALGLGRVVGPLETDAPTAHADDPDDRGHDEAAEAGHGGGREDAGALRLPGGLMVSQDGYTLALDRTRARSGRGVPVSFTVTGPDGRPVTAYDVEHEKQLHLIAVRRDATGFQHVHPRLDPATGTWTVDLDLTPGDWRVLADLVPTGGEGITLGADLAVAGNFAPAPPRVESRIARVGGYTVTLDGELVAGGDSLLTLTVERRGRPVTDLEPYLGAYGHLVALRDGDLAYLHVHPEDGRAGPEVRFVAEVPSTGTYHLYLDFQHRGLVRTAELTASAGGAS